MTGCNSQKSPPAAVIDLFSGAGGLSYGFKTQGFEVVAGVDVDEACRYPYETNIGAPFLRKDVGELTKKEVERLFGTTGRRVMVGCAPCQPFSTYNQKNQDPSWQLLQTFSLLICNVKPHVVSMENVPRLLKFRNGTVFSEFVGRLRKNGYYVVWDVLYGPDFGLAQTRSRLVLLASRLGKIKLPVPTHPEVRRTVRDEIGALAQLKAGEADPNDPLHRCSRLSPVNHRRIAAAKPGGTWREWPEELVTTCHKEESGKGYSSVYGRMLWDEPSPTITTQFFGFGNGRFGHPEQDRALSLREGAMLQGFPADYRFVRPGEAIQFKKVGRMIGNAVPVHLAAAIAASVKSHLRGLA